MCLYILLELYREKYFDFSIRHFHEKLQSERKLELSYTWVQQALQGAGLVKRRRPHRWRRERRPLPGMLLHIDWLQFSKQLPGIRAWLAIDFSTRLTELNGIGTRPAW